MAALVAALLWSTIPPLLAPHVGTVHHGIVAQEVCDGGAAGSYVLIDFNGSPPGASTHNYRVAYLTCLEFLYHHGKGVTITDDAWQDGIASYKFD